MSRRAPATTRTTRPPTGRRPRAATGLLTASAVVALGTATAFAASADEAPEDADTSAAQVERTLVVTPADQIEPVSVESDELTTLLFAALDARAAMDAEAPPEPEPEPEPEPQVEAAVASAGVWDRLAQCESGGNWSINTGNSFYGGLQFTIDSWRWVGGTGYPHEASRETQIAMAERLHARQGWEAWPSCSRQLGLR